MPSVADEAVVLRVAQSGEADAIVHLLARERGRRTAFARAARKSRKRFVGCLEPFHHIRIDATIRRTQRLDQLDQAEAIDSFPELKADLAKLCLASYFCEMVDALLVEGETYPEVFEALLFFLNRLKLGPATAKHRLFFELKVLDYLGHRPDLDRDAEEGALAGGEAWFDPARLAFVSVSSRTAPPSLIRVSRRAREAMIEALERPLDALAEIRLCSAEAAEAIAVTRLLVAAQVARPLKSLDLLDRELGA